MEAVDAVIPPSATLEYASPRAKTPWGPIVFRPSRPALISLTLTAIFAAWLALRHHPWREVARLPSSYYQGSPFTADGRLLTLDPDHGANVWNPDGALVKNILPKLDTGTYQYFIIKGGSQILALPHHEKVAKFHDVESGRVVAEAPNPLALGFNRAAVYPDGSRLISYGLPPKRRAPTTTPSSTTSPATLPLTSSYVWDLTGRGAQWPPAPLKELSTSGRSILISPDGSRLLLPGGLYGFVLIDAKSLEVITSAQGGGRAGWCAFANDDVFYIDGRLSGPAPPGLWEVIELRSTRDGRPLQTTPLVSPMPGTGRLEVSPDARYAFRTQPLRGGVAFGSRLLFPAAVEIWELGTGKLVQTRPGVLGPLSFFPASSRYLTPEPYGERMAVYSPEFRRPLAILPGEGAGTARGNIARVCSQDGRTIALPAGGPDAQWLYLYRPAGWDCPPSHMGALAFPHLWLMTASLIAAAILLRRDAAQLNSSDARAPAFVSAILFAVTLPLTASGLASLCVEQHMEALALAPAALLMVTAIGLATGSRFWCLAALCTLAASLPYELWQTHRIWKAGIPGASLYPVLDRHYEIPHLPALVGHAAATALLGLGLVLLARSTRVAR